MATTALKGQTVNTVADLPQVGSDLPPFTLVKPDLSELTSDELKGKKLVLNIFPSIDTGVCATSVRTFNEKAAGLDDTIVLCVSRDLPFAQARFCGAEGIENVVVASAFRSHFGKDLGVTLADSPMQHLLARAVIVADAEGRVTYTQLVDEITTEPDYDAALEAAKQA
ncbi:thiol peroxidase [Cutibacterium equinum]|uniref:Thiol peroxidase n=1 Tax=Cutibacterium equinum TaxID=3016342 RepID=A0ABY7R1Q8_9ACTN|nr:thiol peroxidase [Cutibacterium equinum]WCC80462.1 thiol peroxidase [Cutibacterium equinum]